MWGSGRLTIWAWTAPLATAVAAVLAWSVWCGTERGTLLGGVLIAMTGVIVFALALEALPHDRRGPLTTLRRTALAIVVGAVSVAVTFVAAGVAYYLCCRPF